MVPESSFTPELMGSLWASRTDVDKRVSFETAKEWFLRAAAIKKSARLLTQLGAVHGALGDNQSATEAYEEALRLDDSYEEAMYNLARRRELSQPDEAIQLLERAIEIDPDYGLAHQALGRLVQKKREYAKAEHHFRRCLEIDPRDYWSMLYLANVLGVQGKEAEAERAYEKAVAFDPTIEIGPLSFARFLDAIGKSGKATEFRSSIKRRGH
jgi:tetratricopeptide (TPR) repeat protein